MPWSERRRLGWTAPPQDQNGISRVCSLGSQCFERNGSAAPRCGVRRRISRHLCLHWRLTENCKSSTQFSYQNKIRLFCGFRQTNEKGERNGRWRFQGPFGKWENAFFK